MNALIVSLKSQSVLGQGLFLAIVGFAGVFVVITAFFLSIVALERAFRARKGK
jgi:hypothetical protein